MAVIPVALAGRAYDVVIAEGLLGRLADAAAPFLKGYSGGREVPFVADSNTRRLYGAAVDANLAAVGFSANWFVVEPGEDAKSWGVLEQLCDWLLALGVTRKDHVFALGGGVVGDLVGFACSVVKRGCGFVQLPTTLLAQVDSSVGGKTAINTRAGKNLIGAFHQPLAVITDISLLDTLPRRELAAGYAEVAKYGLLGDEGFFAWLEGSAPAILRGDTQARIHAIRRSCEAKAAIVAEDETETGVRALLNLGHTFGHALESATGYSQRLLHGEGVSIGMVQAFRFSERQRLCPPGTAERVAKHLKGAGLPVHASEIAGELPPPATLLDIMRQDKKAQGGKLTFILARGIGEAFIARDVADADVLDFLTEDLRQR